MKQVTLILPTYNEKDNIETLIISLEGIFKKLLNYQFKIIVVDDNSPDKTANIVKTLQNKYDNIVLLSKKKEGLGAAYVYAMNWAIKNLSPEIFIQMDADWSHNPMLLPEFFKKYEEGAEFIVGSRYMKGGSIPGNWGIHRKIFSIVGNNYVRFGLLLLKPHDWSTGFRLIKTEIFKKVGKGLEKYSGYTFQIAFLHRAIKAKFKVDEVPLQFIDRVHGRSKFAPTEYIKNVIFYVINNSTFIKYVVIGVIGFSTQSIISKLLVMINIFPGLAVGIGAFIAIICNFLGNNLWTFSENKITGKRQLFKKFSHFLITSIGAVIIQFVVVSVGVIIFGKDAWFGLMIFAIGFLVIPYNYFIYNKFIWKK